VDAFARLGALSIAGYLAMGGEIVDAATIAAPRQRKPSIFGEQCGPSTAVIPSSATARPPAVLERRSWPVEQTNGMPPAIPSTSATAPSPKARGWRID
jgi:hypothetical protein